MITIGDRKSVIIGNRHKNLNIFLHFSLTLSKYFLWWSFPPQTGFFFCFDFYVIYLSCSWEKRLICHEIAMADFSSASKFVMCCKVILSLNQTELWAMIHLVLEILAGHYPPTIFSKKIYSLKMTFSWRNDGTTLSFNNVGIPTILS